MTETQPKQLCPLCKNLYGLDVELEELWLDDEKQYRCKNESLRHQFCDHVLKATKKDIASFACQDCSSPIDECDCYDCMAVFCGQCNGFIFLSCSDVVAIMDINEEKFK